MLEINSANVKGEPGTGFEQRGARGPFECGNCTFFRDESCGQSDMMKHSKEPKRPDGRIEVAAADCCEYINRKGKGSSRIAAAMRRKENA